MFETTYGFIHNGKLHEFKLRRTALLRGTNRVKAPERFYRAGLEDNLGRERTFLDARKRARYLISVFPDHKVTVRTFDKATGNRVDQVRFVTLDKVPPLAGDTRLCEGARRFIGWVEQERKDGSLEGVRYAGGCVCKNTSSGGHSDHADCAAEDIFANAVSMERMRDIAIRYASEFDVKYVILYDRIFSDTYGFQSRPYTGNYHGHIHVSFYGGVVGSAC